MARSLPAPPLRASIDPADESHRQNRADMLGQLAVIDRLLDEAEGSRTPTISSSAGRSARPRSDAAWAWLDGPAASLGKWLRARHADVPVALLEERP